MPTVLQALPYLRVGEADAQLGCVHGHSLGTAYTPDPTIDVAARPSAVASGVGWGGGGGTGSRKLRPGSCRYIIVCKGGEQDVREGWVSMCAGGSRAVCE